MDGQVGHGQTPDADKGIKLVVLIGNLIGQPILVDGQVIRRLGPEKTGYEDGEQQRDRASV